MKTQTISIIGMNRVGASIGLALKKSALDATVIGHDAIREQAQDAKDVIHAIDKVEWNLVSAALKADILVLALPISEVAATLEAVGADLQPHTLVLDLSGHKQQGLAGAQKWLKQGHYVGAVPVYAASWLADGRSDLKAADADLFRKGLFCLMPSPQADPQAVQTAVNFGLLLGAAPYFVGTAEYDSLVQGVGALPGLVSAALFSAASKTPGWQDLLRLAGWPFVLMTAPLENAADTAVLATDDKQATLRWLDAMLHELQQVRRWVYEEETDLLKALLTELGDERAKWLRVREKNDWAEEAKIPYIPAQSFAEQMLGNVIAGRDQDKNNE